MTFALLYFWSHSQSPYTWQVALITYYLVAFTPRPATYVDALLYASERVLSIVIGVVWGALCTAVIWPHHAHKQLHSNCRTALHALSEAFRKMLALSIGAEALRDGSAALDVPLVGGALPIAVVIEEPAQAEGFKLLLAAVDGTIAAHSALAAAVRLERWTKPKRDAPALLFPFFKRASRILDCVGVLLTVPLSAELSRHFQALKVRTVTAWLSPVV